MKTLPRYTTTEKIVGETPLVALERVRTQLKLSQTVPLAYAGRLDPMASGKLLILIGDECKVQEKYHAFDKEYKVEILLGVSSDSGDVLGLVEQYTKRIIATSEILRTLQNTVGEITLPYPQYSSKTIHGKPLHTWALEKKLGEIEIPLKQSRIHRLSFEGVRTISKREVLEAVREKIETIPKVIEERKALGADFRRTDVRDAWNTIDRVGTDNYQVLSFTCIASSGTYMRSLSEKIAQDLGTRGLAYSIHRTKIGTYFPFTKKFGFWLRQF